MSKQKKVKSLGVIKYPDAKLYAYRGGSHTVELEIQGNGKKIRIEFDVWCVKTMYDLVQQIVTRQRGLAQSEEHIFHNLRDYTGWKPPQQPKQ